MLRMIRKCLCMLACSVVLTGGVVGCGGRTTVILLPDQDGTVGGLTVTSSNGTVDISRPGETVVVRGGEGIAKATGIRDEQDIEKEYSQVLSSLPEPPAHFVLYFMSESTVLTEDSQKVISHVLELIQERQPVSIGVVGHTDTAGNERYNAELSLRRAEAVKQLLVKEGVQPGVVETDSHGEHNLLVKTGDGVHEPKNRRVEVVVR